MKRLLIILLLAILPLQAAWAAACACCVGEEGKAVQQSSQAADQQQQTPGDDGDTDKPCCDGGCDACHHLSASAIPSANPDLPLPKGAPHLRGTVRRYVSHIPDLIPPPDRPLRA
ncbi:hypothetical protein [Massilia sp. ST3]|uniref:hypothetical protein n=1 Tax=Massilia sp. ST3 TaxID=2824903 RepID=UPI001B825A33|nr:hypothetical protein [Massilia sp. ST3]MBQ5949078.1 hypothetical protein [Massilia sp. ST3]